MQYELLQQINNENFDDLPLSEHIEWNHVSAGPVSIPLHSINISLCDDVVNTASQKDFTNKIDKIVIGLCF